MAALCYGLAAPEFRALRAVLVAMAARAADGPLTVCEPRRVCAGAFVGGGLASTIAARAVGAMFPLLLCSHAFSPFVVGADRGTRTLTPFGS